MQLLTSLLTVIATISGNSQEKRKKTNFLSTQQITLPEEGESRDE